MRFLIDDNMTPMTEEQFNDCLSRVSEQRREKVLKYKFQAGREQSLKAYMLLQRLLKEEYGITEPPVFRELENGKPVIVGHEDIHFNMSHCKYAVACAVSNEPVGIDAEVIKENVKDDLARYVLSDEELEDLTPLKFTRLWTMKEAVVKLDKMVYEDAKKEFSLASMTGFGADGTKIEKEQDFEQVRGDFDTNPFVTAVLEHIKTKDALGSELIERLKPLVH